MKNPLSDKQFQSIDRLLFENQPQLAEELIRDITKLDVLTARDLMHSRYERLRTVSPEKFTRTDDEYWNEASRLLRGKCPNCDTAIDQQPTFAGMWTGSKGNGSHAGGGIMRTVCGKCSASLLAYEDSYDDLGELIRNPEHDPANVCWEIDESGPVE